MRSRPSWRGRSPLALRRELVLALLAIVGITGLYAGYVDAVAVPAASGLLGHSLGILGFVLMIMTETLYSLRKRAMRRPRGSMRSWLQFHIFTGIVGSYLVILHSAWNLNGLAGGLTFMTVVVVISGFIGRYIYTAVPRTADGVVIEARVLQIQLDAVRQEVSQPSQAGTTTFALAGWGQGPAPARRLRELERQMSALRWARRGLATWHTIHVPLGMVLFVMAFAHIGAAVYYATLLR
jgi:cytochrome b561